MRVALGVPLAMAGAYVATPVAISLANRFGFYDRPGGYKGHRRPTPYLGGTAVMAGFLVALLLVSNGDWERTAPLIAGVAILLGLGTIDDRRTVSVWARLSVEAGLGAFLWIAGLGWDIGLGSFFDLLLTVFWILAVVNAFNLFDNMDGAASIMALVVAAGVVAIGVVRGDTWLAAAAATLCGACLGFLPHNLASPARIFLGDGGSLPIGFAVATLVMTGSAEAAPAWQAMVLGLLLVGVPALDTTLVMVSRRRRGISIVTGGRDHLTHRTQRRLRTARAAAMTLGALQALVSALALFAIRGGAAAIVLTVVLYVLAAALAITLLEASERAPAAVNGVATAGGADRSAISGAHRSALALAVLAALFGLGFGISPLFGGFYAQATWVPLGLGLIALTLAGAISRPPGISRAALLMLGGLAGMALWAMLSSSWAPSIEQATIEGNRMFVLSAILAAALVLVRTDRAAAWLLAGVAAGIGLVAAIVLARLLGSAPSTLFVGGRLNAPLGYINAEGTLFVMGFWLCFSVAERARPWLAGAGAGAATATACLALLSESRGAALAFAGSAVVVLLVARGSRLRRVFALVACGAGVVIASGPVLHVYDAGVLGAIPASAGHRAAIAAILAAAAVAIGWAAATAFYERLVAAGAPAARAARRLAVVVLALGALLVTGVALASATRIRHAASTQWNAFVHLSASPGAEPVEATSSRLVSGAGNRYDYWRVAWHAFVDHPVGGVGAGNYDRPYFKARRTSEDVRQPHSIELQALSELGLVGGALLACFLAGLGLAVWRMRAAAEASPLRVTLGVAGTGMVTAWLVHTSVDWMHLMPGITGIALAGAAVLALQRQPLPEPVRRRAGARPRAIATAAAVGLVLVVAAAGLSRQELADVFRTRAGDALADRPMDAIREANRSLRLDAENPSAYYVKAAALARFDEAVLARRTLLQALAKEPDDFVTWTLLGDLAVRRGRFAEAKRSYAHASALNPRDAALRAMARDPRAALGP